MSRNETTLQEIRPIRGERLLTPEEVAEKLNVSVKTVYTMANDNELPPHRIRSLLRFDEADVFDYVFFSKFRRDNIHCKPSDIKELYERFNDQIEYSKEYVTKFINENVKGADMKK
jgi:excisionase family DNA binding protein